MDSDLLIYGHGKSEGLEINFKEYVNVLYELCKYLKLQKVVICGLSKGLG